MGDNLSETFFRPDEMTRERLNIPASLYNQCRLMLTRCDYQHIFVPVRSMQFQAVIDKEEVIFVDNQAYAVHNGEGGKLIRLAWKFRHDLGRDNLNEPVQIELVCYDDEARDLHTRLIGEFRKSLEIMEERYKEKGCEARISKVVDFPR